MFTLAYNKIFKPEYLHIELDSEQNSNLNLADSGINGDYIITEEFNGHPVYSNRNK